MVALIILTIIVTDILILMAETLNDVLLLAVSLAINFAAAIHVIKEEEDNAR
jgi:hypothetical protein